MKSLGLFLKQRARVDFDRLLKQLNDLESSEAFEGRLENWPDQPFGIGQDGSIAGIVIHLAAWKRMTLPIFSEGNLVIAKNDFDIRSECDPNDWTSILSWINRVGEEWLNHLVILPEEKFSDVMIWADKPIP